MRKSADIIGLLMIYLVLTFLTMALTAPIIAIALNFDPIGIIMEDYRILSDHWILKISIRFVLFQHCVIGLVRSYAMFYLPVVSNFSIFLSCLRRISEMPHSENCIKYYTQLRIIQLTGMTSVSILAGQLMSIGFIMSVVGAWIIISGRKIFPVLVYHLMTVITVVIYIVIAETIPKVVECDELSKKLTTEILPRRKFRNICLESTFENKIWKKVLLSQKPLTFYYASASFDRETKHNFYYNIFMNTVNMVLLTRRNILL